MKTTTSTTTTIAKTRGLELGVILGRGTRSQPQPAGLDVGRPGCSRRTGSKGPPPPPPRSEGEKGGSKATSKQPVSKQGSQPTGTAPPRHRHGDRSPFWTTNHCLSRGRGQQGRDATPGQPTNQTASTLLGWDSGGGGADQRREDLSHFARGGVFGLVFLWGGGYRDFARPEAQTNLGTKGRTSTDRSTKATLMLTVPRSITKSSTEDLTRPTF